MTSSNKQTGPQGNRANAAPKRLDCLPHVADTYLRSDSRRRRNFLDAELIVRKALADFGALCIRVMGRRGPKAVVDLHALLMGRIAAALDGKYTIAAAADVLNDLPDSLLNRILGARSPRSRRTVSARMVYKRWEILMDEVSGSEYAPGRRAKIDKHGVRTTSQKPRLVDPRGRCRLEGPELVKHVRALGRQGLARNLCEEERDRRRELCVELANAIVRASVDFGLCDPSTYSCDWTDVEARATTYRRAKDSNAADDASEDDLAADNSTVNDNAQDNPLGNRAKTTDQKAKGSKPKDGKRRIVKSSADPDAAWGRRSPKDTGRISRGLTARIAAEYPELANSTEWEPNKNEFFFGNILFGTAAKSIFVGGPELLVDLDLRPANDHAHSARYVGDMLARLRAHNLPVDCLAMDMGFSQYELVHLAAADQGVKLIYDIKQQMVGIRGHVDGAPLLNGVPVCPAILHRAKAMAATEVRPPAPTMKEEKRRAAILQFRALRDTLDPLRFVAVATDETLPTEYVCPAVAGKMRCPLQQQSMSLGYDVPEVYESEIDRDSEGTPPKCCVAGRVQTPSTVGFKIRQEPALYSDEWEIAYDARGCIERQWNRLKNQNGLDGANRYENGIAARLILSACLTAAMNIKAIRAWAAGHPEYKAPTLAAPRHWHPDRHRDPASPMAA